MQLAGVAHAQDSQTAAHAKYDRAITEYNLQNWDAALRDFQDVYREVHDSVILFNIGQCQHQLGDYEAAAKSYRLYLAQSPNAPNEEQVRRLIAQMDDAAREKRAQAPPLAVKVQDTPPPTTETPVAEVSRKSELPWYRDGVGLGLAASGLAVVAGGGALLGLAANEGSAADRSQTQAGFDLHHRNDLTDQKAGWPLLGIGIGALAAGTIVFAIRVARHR
ncbi:MAG: tetratricopeptide repeat protein [Polyangia bacterium]